MATKRSRKKQQDEELEVNVQDEVVEVVVTTEEGEANLLLVDEVSTPNEEVVENAVIEEPVISKPGLWKKLGKGGLRWKNRIIKPGQIFEAFKEELPAAFLDTLEEVEPEIGKPKVPETKKMQFSKKQAEDDLWNIVDANGRILNEVPMSEEEADELLKELL